MTVMKPGEFKYPSSPLGEVEDGIPTGRDVPWEPLVDYRRAGVSETTIHGAVGWAHGDEVIHQFGGNVLCYGRSMMKPFMMRVFKDVLADLKPEQQAISLASHNGTPEHVAAAQSLLKRDEWGMMQTPLDVPLIQFGRQVRRPRRWYHCCSGEHAAIVRGCREKGWSRVGYTVPTHPFFKGYMEELQKILGADWQPTRVGRDGCGLPTVSNTVSELALCMASLVQHREDDWIWDSMVQYPDLIGGFNRLDSTIIKAGGGQVIAKEGADGLLGLGIIHPDYPNGLGVVIKIAHGWNAQATWYVARAVLGVLDIDLRNPYALHRQKAFLVSGIVPDQYLSKLEEVKTWDEWDPNRDTYDYRWVQYPMG